MSEEQQKYPIIEELAPATEEEMAFWETEEAWPNPDDGYDILGFPIRSQDDPEEDAVDQIAQGVFNGLFAKNCGIAAGGFQPGNDCAKGGGRARQLEEFSYEEMDAWRVEPVNPVRSKEHLDAIIESLSENGWQGAPVLAMAYGDGTKALTGSHRILAARQVKDEYGDSLPIPVQKIENDALELEVNGTPLWEALEGAIRDDDRADVLEQYAQEHGELREAADLMRFEVEKSDELDTAGPGGFAGR